MYLQLYTVCLFCGALPSSRHFVSAATFTTRVSHSLGCHAECHGVHNGQWIVSFWLVLYWRAGWLILVHCSEATDTNLCFCRCSIQCQSLLQFHRFPSDWAVHPSFVGGLIIATSGMILNIQSDATLRRLKSQGKGYVIPRGGLLFDHVSCPHFLGEIVQWIGFAAACQTSTVAASFAAFTCANLIPRAAQQHAWYKQHFAETYPSHRKAWLPCVW